MDKRDISFLGLLPNEGDKISWINADLLLIALALCVVALCYYM